jgi:hypothetical protein
MDNNTIRDIVSWIKSHPKHADELCNASPTVAYLSFISNPDLVWDYEDNYINQEVQNGCSYVFIQGPEMLMTCGQETVKGKDRCKFHSHPIFSDDVRNYIHKYHTNINQLCSLKDT